MRSAYVTTIEHESYQRVGFGWDAEHVWSFWAFEKGGRFFAIAEREAVGAPYRKVAMAEALSEDTALDRLRTQLGVHYEGL